MIRWLAIGTTVLLTACSSNSGSGDIDNGDSEPVVIEPVVMPSDDGSPSAPVTNPSDPAVANPTPEPMPAPTNPPSEPGSTTAIDFPVSPALPAGCVGAIDGEGIRYCVQSSSREISATLSDGSLWWSFVLPGDNASNHIESVVAVGNVIALVTNRLPNQSFLTPEQRANQYEISVFEKSGEFIQTIPLTFDLQWNGESDPQPVFDLRDDGVFGNAMPVAAYIDASGAPTVMVGWHRWRDSANRRVMYDLSGIATVDLNTGALTQRETYPESDIRAIDIDQSEHRLIRIVTSRDVYWRTQNNFSEASNDSLVNTVPDGLIPPTDPNSSQLNGSNYLAVINALLPWINAEPPKRLLFGADADQQPSNIPFPLESFTLLDQYILNDQYEVTESLCDNGGRFDRVWIVSVAINYHYMDECQMLGSIYSGRIATDYVGRDGFSINADRLRSRDPDGGTRLGSNRYALSRSRVVSGSSRSYGLGSYVEHNHNGSSGSSVVTDYYSDANFFFGRMPNGQSTCYAYFDGDEVVATLSCVEHIANGSLETDFVINADWTHYQDLDVSMKLSFGNTYFEDLTWIGLNGYDTSTLPANPDNLPTQPETSFFIKEGTIDIVAPDGSRLSFISTGDKNQLWFDVKITDQNGNDSGVFAPEVLNIECESRLDVCVADTQN